MPCHARPTGPSAHATQSWLTGSKQYVSLRYTRFLQPPVMSIFPSSTTPAWAYTWREGQSSTQVSMWRPHVDGSNTLLCHMLLYLFLQGGHKLPRVGVRVVALH